MRPDKYSYLENKTWEELFSELAEKIMSLDEDELAEVIEKAGPILSGGAA